MNGLIQIAESILSASERRLEVVSHNIANTGTAGFKSQVAFTDYLAVSSSAAAAQAEQSQATDFSQGRLSQTNSPLDFAISGNGLFKVRSGDSMFYTRQGQFQMVEGGRIVTPHGMVLQAASGGDLVLNTLAARVLENGTVMEDGVPTTRIGIYEANDINAMQSVGGTMFIADENVMSETSGAVVRQGMIEAANVTVADQMTLMMSSIREAETGSKLVQTYDNLMGQAISTFGQGSR